MEIQSLLMFLLPKEQLCRNRETKELRGYFPQVRKHEQMFLLTCLDNTDMKKMK